MDKNTIANIIVDLYEMRAASLEPLQAQQMEKVYNLFQYNFLNVIISQLCDKYKVKHQEIDFVIRERQMSKIV